MFRSVDSTVFKKPVSLMSFEEVVTAYKNTVYGIALTRTGNSTDADDIFQEVFLAYHRYQPDFNDEEHRKAWLIKVTENCVKMFLKKNRRNTVEYNEALSDRLISFETEEENAVYSALLELPEKYRTVIYKHYFIGLSAEEIGKTLHMRGGAVRMRMLRGREMLREKLKGEYL